MSQLRSNSDAYAPADRHDAVVHLRGTHLFGELDADSLNELGRRCTRRRVEAGEAVVTQGTAGERLYVLCEGRLQVVERAADGRELVLGEVRAGEHFGEIALFERKPRMASVLAKVESELLVLHRDDLWSLLARHPNLEAAIRFGIADRVRWAEARRVRPSPARIREVLGGFIGERADAATLEHLEDEVQWLTLPRGATLMRQGELGDSLYLVATGRLLVSGRRDDGTPLHINEIGPGESVGEMALLSNERRSADVSVLRDSELLRLSKRGFERLVDRHPRAMASLSRLIVTRLNQRIRGRAVITQLRAMPLTTLEDCEDVMRTTNHVLRNLRITEMYYRVSLELTTLLGHQDANWWTFGCNASKTAGYSIRREELPFYDLVAALPVDSRASRALDRIGDAVEETALARRVAQILDRVSDAISEGNLRVFAELAPAFIRFIRTFHGDAEYDRDKLQRFLDTLTPGATESGGQDTLREALSHYYEASFELQTKRRSELILLGNIKVGLHEQIRLQPNIAGALEEPIRFGLGGLLGAGASRVPGLGRVLERGLRRVEGAAMERLTAEWRRLATRNLMTLRLPYGRVRLGEDLPRLPNERIFPDVLQKLEHPELVHLVARFSRGEGLSRTGAADWGRLEDRMCFVANLFRSRQRSLELFDPPFLEEQRAELALGRIPDGRL